MNLDNCHFKRDLLPKIKNMITVNALKFPTVPYFFTLLCCFHPICKTTFHC